MLINDVTVYIVLKDKGTILLTKQLYHCLFKHNTFISSDKLFKVAPAIHGKWSMLHVSWHVVRYGSMPTEFIICLRLTCKTSAGSEHRLLVTALKVPGITRPVSYFQWLQTPPDYLHAWAGINVNTRKESYVSNTEVATPFIECSNRIFIIDVFSLLSFACLTH